MVTQGPAERGEKELRRDWPHEEGLTAGTQTQEGRISKLEPTEGTVVLSRTRVLL